MAACMLLWSGALTFERGAVVWDGHSHRISSPTIDQGVISLYAVPYDQVEGVVPDLLDLLETLERDEGLRVPDERVAKAVREALVSEHLTGATLFMLQSGLHPLIVEPIDNRTLQVRYDERLARGVPGLQTLICRMLCHLRLFQNSAGPFAVQFVESGGMGSRRGIRDYKGCVEGAVSVLDTRVEVADPSVEVASAQEGTLDAQARAEANDAKPTSFASSESRRAASDFAASNSAAIDPAVSDSDQRFLRAVCLLESKDYATRQLIDSTKRRLTWLEEESERIDQAKPNPKAAEYRTSSAASRKLPGTTRAIRSLAIWSAFYMAIGAALFMAGRTCAMEGESLARALAGSAHEALGIATDFLSLMFGNASMVGQENLLDINTQPMQDALRVVGFVLMGLGILLPVRKILKHKKRLDHELAYSKSHADYLEALVERQRMDAEKTYSSDLEAWASNVRETEKSIGIAKSSLEMLEEAEGEVTEALKRCHSLRRIPEGMDDVIASNQRDSERSAKRLVASVEAETSEERRHQRVVDHCDDVHNAIASASR